MAPQIAQDSQLQTLYAEGYSQSALAQLLGIPRRTLRDRLKVLGPMRRSSRGRLPRASTPPPPLRPLTDTELAHVRDMLRETLRAIAASERVPLSPLLLSVTVLAESLLGYVA
jgi:Bacterial regulatory protein, Fis family